MTDEHTDPNVTLEVDEEVTKFLETVQGIEAEVGEFKSYREEADKKHEDLSGKVDTLVKGFESFLTTFKENKEKEKEDDKVKKDLIPDGIKDKPERQTLIEDKGAEKMNEEDAIDAGLRAIAIGSLDPDVKEIVIMSDLSGRHAYKPRPDPNARRYNIRLAES
jgi:hypothetical protein